MSAPDGERRAWGWLAHLRDGGTTPWREWTDAADQGRRVLPGAQQLELLRRLNLAGRPPVALVERVLTASAPGRGRPDLELAGAVERPRFGPPPVDPGDLPADELIRVATSLLADDLVAAGVPPRRVEGPRRPWRTRYRLVGDPWLADPVREELVALGRPPGGRGAVVLVLGAGLDRMLVDAWTSRAFDEGGPSWPAFLQETAGRRRVPARVDLVDAARRWSRQVGRGRVKVVLDPAALPRLVGVRRPLPAPFPVSADATDLARRVGSVLGLLVVPPRRTELLRHTFLPRVSALGGAPLVVPDEQLPWVARRAERVRETLHADGYPVVGDLDALRPRPRDGAGAPDDDGVLALALELLLEDAGPGAGDDGRTG
ncbi:hypothetical protein [Nocardioides dongkuii]|uniref:hypothetical protein n=1 Tax=Nocardioides dongkuii TaxID=2760089 RepID=UPI0015FCBE9D|nr:hypothetical protein [Nocardioides dongkuii]